MAAMESKFGNVVSTNAHFVFKPCCGGQYFLGLEWEIEERGLDNFWVGSGAGAIAVLES